MHMDNRGSTSDVISSYRKRRQQSNILFVYGASGLLVLAGLALLVFWLTGPSKPLEGIFATKTPTPTITPSPTDTPLPTDTPTITATPTQTVSPTASGPFQYTVQENDSLASIASKFNLGDNGILLLYQLNPTIDPANPVIHVGDVIWVANPGMQLFTSTPVPGNLPSGTQLKYTVQPNDNLAGIASEFNSTVDDIVKTNNLADANAIYVGQQLTIRVNLVTPTATRPPTSTPRTLVAPGTLVTLTPPATITNTP